MEQTYPPAEFFFFYFPVELKQAVEANERPRSLEPIAFIGYKMVVGVALLEI